MSSEFDRYTRDEFLGRFFSGVEDKAEIAAGIEQQLAFTEPGHEPPDDCPCRGGKLAWSAGGAAQDRGPARGPALFGTQEQAGADFS